MQTVMRNSIERACPACGADTYLPFAEEHIDQHKITDFTYASRKQPEFMCLRLVRCKSCDLVYAPVPPEPGFLSSAYSEAAFDSGTEASAAARSYAKALTPYIDQLQHRGAAVDVGAGSGPLLPWLCERGFNPVIGIEPSRAAIESAPSEVRPMLREGMFSPSMLVDIRPSLICSFMTLEHLSNPGCFIKDANHLLEPGGMLAVVVHNWRAPLNRILGLHSPIIDVEHLQLFNKQSIRTLIQNAGFVSVEVKSISNAYPIRYWLRLTPLPNRIKNCITVILDKIGLSEFIIPFRVGNILAIGKKPMEKTDA